jgi:hypothetical protein
MSFESKESIDSYESMEYMKRILIHLMHMKCGIYEKKRSFTMPTRPLPHSISANVLCCFATLRGIPKSYFFSFFQDFFYPTRFFLSISTLRVPALAFRNIFFFLWFSWELRISESMELRVSSHLV